MSRELWAVHAAGPDDVTPAPSMNEAMAMCVLLNSNWIRHASRDVPQVRWKAVRWQHTPEAHAAGLPMFYRMLS